MYWGTTASIGMFAYANTLPNFYYVWPPRLLTFMVKTQGVLVPGRQPKQRLDTNLNTLSARLAPATFLILRHQEYRPFSLASTTGAKAPGRVNLAW